MHFANGEVYNGEWKEGKEARERRDGRQMVVFTQANGKMIKNRPRNI